VVALGADPGAMIGRAEAVQFDQPEVATFWRGMAGSASTASANGPGIDTGLWPHVTTTTGTTVPAVDPAPDGESDESREADPGVSIDLEIEEPSEEAKAAAAAAAIREAIEQARGTTLREDEIQAELLQALGVTPEKGSFMHAFAELREGFDAFTAEIRQLVEGRETDGPPPSEEERDEPAEPLSANIVRPSELVAAFREELAKARTEVCDEFRARIKKARGEL
jgi:hypothetical protein